MDKTDIIIIEDDSHILKLVKYNLEKENFRLFTAVNAEKALDILRSKPISLIILDIMLPGMDGFEFCKMIKQDNNLKNIPVIMLTAKGEEVNRIVGLELGADDYIVKPFSIRELVLRIKSVLRRKIETKIEKETICIADIVIDIPKHKVMVKGKEAMLTVMEFGLLVILIQRIGRIQTRDRLLADVWGIETQIDTRTVDTHIKKLRKKLGKSGGLIETIRGVGYRFKET
jgi:DNA-binding response OmpR family regulator